jgi:hypothetical protein
MTVSTTDLVFPFVFDKPIVARFDGGDITSDAGALLLGEADRKLSLCESLAGTILDKRDPAKIAHTILDLLRERIFAIALGYEDANDLDTLADDPALRAACGRKLCAEDRLASQPTISRLENRVDSKDLLVMSTCLAQVVVNQLPANTKRVILDVDASEDPCHGQQEFEFFNAHYGSHCYLPLLLHITADGDRQRLVAAMLRPGRADSKTGLFGILRRAIDMIRTRFPGVEIILRADGGFGQAEVIEFCTLWELPFVLGLPTNARLKRLALPYEQDALKQAADEQAISTDEPSGETTRYYAEFDYKADTWSAPRRVIDRIEITRGEVNARFVVSNMSDLSMDELYEFYCERGEQENRIKELKLDLASGRTSCHRFYANQFRLLLHAAASALMCAIQDGLKGTHLQNAQVGTIRLKILKVGAQAKESVRVLWFRLSSTFVNRELWYLLYSRLSAT